MTKRFVIQLICNKSSDYRTTNIDVYVLLFFVYIETAVRLVEGTSEYEGRLEVYKFGRWGTVCGNTENNTVSAVVCRSLGLPW